ncbi:DNA primase [Galactobacter valiniphilus]|uniref:DNA primase n=1 Tax=Galactobacter valiniphilus TaxID=2676122 RepID=A0A399J8S9_9MICC|nr:DNA primase [Galactobacter valiniphilus]RII41674.1 DNA primase [Galactobacter valiniphilus]
MPGLIKRDDIDEVRTRTDIKAVVEAFVSLKPAGIGSYKGLCPFHDERSPSFHVRPQVGTYHCFGCGESGDAISFLMKMNHTSFAETVEQLAARVGLELHYEDGGKGPDRESVGKRQRLLDAHKVAEEFYRAQLQTPEAAEGQKMLAERGFTPADAARFGVGYAPQGWDALLRHLRNKGFTDDELKLTGLMSEGQRGIYDRFRGRLIWPIRDLTGATIGFGARKLYEDDPGPKYLNTPETQLYKKSQVLYGIDLAKREISKQKRIVVVEGYTDVMAAQLAGVGTAVATCGTAFGTDHIKIARRLLSDFGGGGEVIFCFDGDAAGQKAALRAFQEDQRFVAQTYVCVEPSGMDPCELRQERGDEAVVELIENKRPLFEFAIKVGLVKYDLNTVEGRVNALREAAPVVAAIRDPAMRPGYARELAGWLGMDPNEVMRSVRAAGGRARHAAPAQGHDDASQGEAVPSPGAAPVWERPDTRDPVVRMEREALEVVLQHPNSLSAEAWQAVYGAHFVAPAHAAVKDAIVNAAAAQTPMSRWVEAIRESVPEPLAAFVAELAVVPLPAASDDQLALYCRGIMNRLFDIQINHAKAELLGRLQRLAIDAPPEEAQALNRELMELEMRRRSLRAET